MIYQHDPDLNFFGHLKDEDFNDLVSMLTQSKNGRLRVTEELTEKEIYKRLSPQHSHYWQEIVNEFKSYYPNNQDTDEQDNNTTYRDILVYVMRKLDIQTFRFDPIDALENKLLLTFFERIYMNMSLTEKIEFNQFFTVPDELNHEIDKINPLLTDMLTCETSKAYQLSLFIVNCVVKTVTGRSLVTLGETILSRNLDAIVCSSDTIVGPIWKMFVLGRRPFSINLATVCMVTILRKKT